jgi:hypothetical protein
MVGKEGYERRLFQCSNNIKEKNMKILTQESGSWLNWIFLNTMGGRPYQLNKTFNYFRTNYHSSLSSYISCSVKSEIHFLEMQIMPEFKLFPFL